MNEFDKKAFDWDKNPMHIERSSAIAGAIEKAVPLRPDMQGFEYGCGTGLLSFNLAGKLKAIRLADSSEGMLSALKEKIRAGNIRNMQPVFIDLEKSPAPEEKTDLVFTQMVMHHVSNIEMVLEKFYFMLNDGGFVCIADLYAEDGSFHGESFTGHHGFDPEKLKNQLENAGFIQVKYRECYQMKTTSGEIEKNYPVFLMTGIKRKD